MADASDLPKKGQSISLTTLSGNQECSSRIGEQSAMSSTTDQNRSSISSGNSASSDEPTQLGLSLVVDSDGSSSHQQGNRSGESKTTRVVTNEPSPMQNGSNGDGRKLLVNQPLTSPASNAGTSKPSSLQLINSTPQLPASTNSGSSNGNSSKTSTPGGMHVSQSVSRITTPRTELLVPETSSSSVTPCSSEQNITSSSGKAYGRRKPGLLSVFSPTYRSRAEQFQRLFVDGRRTTNGPAVVLGPPTATSHTPSVISRTERLVADFSCALQREILAHGRMFISPNYICFYANIFGWETHIVIPSIEVKSITKEKTAKLIPNAIAVRTESGHRYFFTSFGSRDKAYGVLLRVWQASLFGQPLSPSLHWKLIREVYGTCNEADFEGGPELYSGSVDKSRVVGRKMATMISDGNESTDGDVGGDADALDRFGTPGSEGETGVLSEPDTRSLTAVRVSKRARWSVAPARPPVKSPRCPLHSNAAAVADHRRSSSAGDSSRSGSPLYCLCAAVGNDVSDSERDYLSAGNANSELSLQQLSASSSDEKVPLAAHRRSSSSGAALVEPVRLGGRAAGSVDGSASNSDRRSGSSSESEAPEPPSDKRPSPAADAAAAAPAAKSRPLRRAVSADDNVAPGDAHAATSSDDDALPDVPYQRSCTHDHPGQLLLDEIYPVSARRLFDIIFTSPLSPVMVNLFENRNCFDLSSDTWNPSADASVGPAERRRKVSYQMRLNNTIGPKQFRLVENHSWTPLFGANGCHLSYRVSSLVENIGIPYEDSFYGQTHFCIRPLAAGDDAAAKSAAVGTHKHQCRLIVTGEVIYRKQLWSLVKSFIAKNTLSGMVEHYSTLHSLLAEETAALAQRRKQRRRHRGDTLIDKSVPTTAASVATEASSGAASVVLDTPDSTTMRVAAAMALAAAMEHSAPAVNTSAPAAVEAPRDEGFWSAAPVGADTAGRLAPATPTRRTSHEPHAAPQPALSPPAAHPTPAPPPRLPHFSFAALLQLLLLTTLLLSTLLHVATYRRLLQLEARLDAISIVTPVGSSGAMWFSDYAPAVDKGQPGGARRLRGVCTAWRVRQRSLLRLRPAGAPLGDACFAPGRARRSMRHGR